jgi:hypothetical protein
MKKILIFTFLISLAFCQLIIVNNLNPLCPVGPSYFSMTLKSDDDLAPEPLPDDPNLIPYPEIKIPAGITDPLLINYYSRPPIQIHNRKRPDDLNYVNFLKKKALSNMAPFTTNTVYSLYTGVRIFSAPCSTSAISMISTKYDVFKINATAVPGTCDANLYVQVLGGQYPGGGYVKVSDVATCIFYCSLAAAATDLVGSQTVLVLNGPYKGPININANNIILKTLNADFNPNPSPMVKDFQCSTVRNVNEVLLYGGPLGVAPNDCVINIGSTTPGTQLITNVQINGFTFNMSRYNALQAQGHYGICTVQDTQGISIINNVYMKINTWGTAFRATNGYLTYFHSKPVYGTNTQTLIQNNCLSLDPSDTNSATLSVTSLMDQATITGNYWSKQQQPIEGNMGMIVSNMLYVTNSNFYNNFIDTAPYGWVVSSGYEFSQITGNTFEGNGVSITMISTSYQAEFDNVLPVRNISITQNYINNIKSSALDMWGGFLYLGQRGPFYNITFSNNIINVNANVSTFTQAQPFHAPFGGGGSQFTAKIISYNSYGSTIMTSSACTIYGAEDCITNYNITIYNNIFTVDGLFQVPNIFTIDRMSIFNVYGAFKYVTIEKNSFINNAINLNSTGGIAYGTGYISAIQFLEENSNTLAKTPQNISIINNTITGFDIAISTGILNLPISSPNLIAGTIHVHYNNIYDNDVGYLTNGDLYGRLTDNATCNYWGNVNGARAVQLPVELTITSAFNTYPDAAPKIVDTYADSEVIVVPFLNGLYGARNGDGVLTVCENYTFVPDCTYLDNCHDRGLCIWNTTSCTSDYLKELYLTGVSTECSPICDCTRRPRHHHHHPHPHHEHHTHHPHHPHHPHHNHHPHHPPTQLLINEEIVENRNLFSVNRVEEHGKCHHGEIMDETCECVSIRPSHHHHHHHPGESHHGSSESWIILAVSFVLAIIIVTIGLIVYFSKKDEIEYRSLQ